MIDPVSIIILVIVSLVLAERVSDKATHFKSSCCGGDIEFDQTSHSEVHPRN